jgi:hypothetical protein
MTKSDPILIYKTANGFMVVDETRLKDPCVPPGTVLVFNDLGYAMNERDDSKVPSLLKFLEQHFSE